MELPEMLRKLLASAHIIEVHHAGCDHEDDDDSGWTQVARLGQDDIVKRRAHDIDLDRARTEIEVLLAKLDSVKAAALANKAEWWAYLRKTYGLPATAPLRLKRDGRILLKTEKDAD